MPLNLEKSTSICQGCGASIEQAGRGRRRKWCSERCRKASYGDPCVDCGARTSFGSETARVPEPRCRACSALLLRLWPREAIVAAIQEWASVHGEAPAVGDWNPYQAREVYHDDARAARYEADPLRWPSHTTVYAEFGSWNSALAAAGFVPRSAHGGSGNYRRQRRFTNAAA